METQTLLGLLPFMRKMGIQNSQVHLTKLTVPSDPIVSMLLHHKQALQQAANPTVQVHFGSSPKIITSAQNVGQLSIPHVTHNRYLCWAGTTPHTPQLSGTLTEAPLGNKNWMKRLINWFLNGKPISLSITDLEFNLQSLQIETTKIRLGVIGLRCLELESVNRQFGTEANQMLQQLMRKIGPHNFELP